MIQHADPVLEREARFSGAQRTRLRLETGGRVFLPLAVIGLLLGWAAGDVALLFAASALAIPAVAALWAWMNGAGLELRLAPEPPHPVGEPFQFELELHSRPGPGRLRDLLLAVERPAPRPGDAPREARPSGVACELPRGAPPGYSPERPPPRPIVPHLSCATRWAQFFHDECRDAGAL